MSTPVSAPSEMTFFSTLMACGSFSGAAVEALTPAYGLLGAYATAFVATGLTAIPPMLLLVLLWRMQRAVR